ncbi:MAG: DUF4367 domain-containing protein [Clostridia bacterium]|nr:DUF4367 domain-containing protein [Clostridia bacterium]
MDKYTVNRTDRELFKQALAEARQRTLEATLQSCPDDVLPSPDQREKMDQFIQQLATPKRNYKKRLLAVLIAALLAALVGCTLYVYRDKIGNFIEEKFGDHAVVAVDEPADNIAYAIPEEDQCVLTYIPEGYELYTESTAFETIKIWKNQSDEKIKFEQNNYNAKYYHDIEQGYSFMAEINSMQVYYREWETSDGYIWTNHTYVYKLVVPKTLSEDEAIKIIENIQIQK